MLVSGFWRLFLCWKSPLKVNYEVGLAWFGLEEAAFGEFYLKSAPKLC